MLFTFKAKSAEGGIISGEEQAADKYALARELRARGHTPIKIEAKKSFDVNNLDFIAKFFSKVSTAELILFTKNLGGMLKAGLSLSRGLSVLEKQTRNPKLKDILHALSNEINSGGSLSSGLEKFPRVFSAIFVSMTRAGEESGDLSGALAQIGANLEKSHSLRKKIKGAMIYPGVIVSAMVVIGILMFAFVVPTLAATFADLGVELPMTTRLVVGLGTFFSNNLILSFLIVIGFAVSVTFLFKAKFMAKYIDFLVLKLPVVGPLARELNTARTARTISSLLIAGVSITRALEITGEVVQNIYYQRVLVVAKENIEQGKPMSATFEDNGKLYPVMMSEMVQVGEETGNLSNMLSEVALFYENDIEEKTRNLSTIIEPVLMVLVGAAVGFFAISMISPLYSVLENIQ